MKSIPGKTLEIKLTYKCSFNRKMKIYLHTLIALLALTIGYPYGGMPFIVLMIPYLIYMIMKRDSVFLPALILHAASETSASTVIFITFIVLSIINYRKLINQKLGVLFWLLIGLLPIFAWLVIFRISRMGEYLPLSFAYIGYYLSFFAFFYGVLIANTFNKQIVMTVMLSIFLVFLFYVSGVIGFTRIIVSFSFFFIGALSMMFNLKKINYLLLMLSIFAFYSLFSNPDESTLTMMFVSLFTFSISMLYFRNKNKAILSATGFIPFILIFILYWYGINNYLKVDLISAPEITGGFNNLSERLSFKFFADRAPYWTGGFTQIIGYKHLLPIPDIPDIIATTIDQREIEITFGSHTTFIELIRKFGIIAGGGLSFTLIYIVVISRKVFTIKNIEAYTVIFFSMAFATTITLCLTGQYQIMPGYALLSLGVLGICYNKQFKFNKSVQRTNLIVLLKNKILHSDK